MKTAGGDVLNRTPANGERGVAGYDGSGSDTFWKDAEEQLASNPGQEGGAYMKCDKWECALQVVPLLLRSV